MFKLRKKGLLKSQLLRNIKSPINRTKQVLRVFPDTCTYLVCHYTFICKILCFLSVSLPPPALQLRLEGLSIN